jgi:hypothetical protein
LRSAAKGAFCVPGNPAAPPSVNVYSGWEAGSLPLTGVNPDDIPGCGGIGVVGDADYRPVGCIVCCEGKTCSKLTGKCTA